MQKSSYLLPEKLYPEHFTPEGNSVTMYVTKRGCVNLFDIFHVKFVMYLNSPSFAVEFENPNRSEFRTRSA